MTVRKRRCRKLADGLRGFFVSVKRVDGRQRFWACVARVASTNLFFFGRLKFVTRAGKFNRGRSKGNVKLIVECFVLYMRVDV